MRPPPATLSPTMQKGKKRLTEEQVRVLEKSFCYNKKLDPERKVHLARELGVASRQVAIWYQNKRARWKAQTMETDYNVLQEKLEAALAEKKVMERDVELLRAELQKAHHMLLLQHQKAERAPTCLEGPASSSNNSNVNDIVSCCWEWDDLYTYLMFASSSSAAPTPTPARPGLLLNDPSVINLDIFAIP